MKKISLLFLLILLSISAFAQYIISEDCSDFKINNTNSLVSIGMNLQLSTNALEDEIITWSSSNENIAIVNENGTVTGISEGKCKIYAAKVNNPFIQDYIYVEVYNQFPDICKDIRKVRVTGVSLDETSKTIYVGDTFTLTATVKPSDATNKNVIWSSSNTTCATVDENGVVSGIKVGSTYIYVQTLDGGYSAKCKVTVKAKPSVKVTGVSLDVTSKTIYVGDTFQLTETVRPSNATNKNVTWKSSNTKIVTVDNGVVKGIAKGSATITVTTTDGKKTATCKVTVKKK